jgi:hypothetical protein
MTALLPLPSMLHYNKRKRRRQRQQHCRCCFRCTPTKETKEGDGSIAAVTFCAIAKKKEKGNSNVVIVTFFAMLQQEKIKKAWTTLLLSPSSLHCKKKKRKRQRQQHCHRLLRCNKIKVTTTLLLSPSALQEREENESNGNKAAVTLFVALPRNEKKGDINVVIVAFFAVLQQNK